MRYLDWHDRMDRVLVKGRKRLKQKDQVCGACGEQISGKEVQLVLWTSELKVAQLCEVCGALWVERVLDEHTSGPAG